MRPTRLAVPLLIGAGLLLSSCESPVPPEPADALSAKGGVKGPGGGGDDGGTTEPEVTVEEYWITTDAAGLSTIHMAGTGPVRWAGVGVAHDHFFNGARDDDPPVDAHYEYYLQPFIEEGKLKEWDEAAGTWHFDFPWAGRVKSSSFPDGAPYRDFPATSIASGGADPFVFHYQLLDENQAFLQNFRPLGVVEGGNDTGEAERTVAGSAYHTVPSDVRSFAVHQGPAPDGVAFVSQLDLTAATCSRRPLAGGKGKKTGEAVREVTLDFSLAVDFDPAPGPGSFWMELHAFDRSSAALSPRSSGSGSTGDGSRTFVFPDGPSDMDVELHLDFLLPTGGDYGYAYDPGRNTNTGFTTTGSWPSTAPYDGLHPVASSASVAVTCK